MTHAQLACTVRGCGRLLSREGRALRCPQGHAYDLARSGYVNLLQPQDRRSPHAGDSREVVAARARLTGAGIGDRLVDACVDRITSLALPADAQIADLGCGTGHLLARVAQAGVAHAVGIDLSVAAIDHAARRHPGLTWVVANADRTLPLPDNSTTVLLSIHARRHPADCARALMPGGWLLVAVPAHDDLAELRASVMGAAAERDRVGPLTEEHAPFFDVQQAAAVRETHACPPDVLSDLVMTTYRARPQRTSAVQALDAMTITVASDLVLFRKRQA
jgi:23S rRNA (guanine745-N1)-methyltransferase